MNLLFFFGSGISVPHGLPRVDEITERILTHDYHRHTDSSYYQGKNMGDDLWDPTQRVQAFLKVLYDHNSAFLKEQGYNTKPNYEHLYHLCNQIERTKLQYGDNSAVREFVHWVERETTTLIDDPDSPLGYLPNLAHLANEAMVLIECVVWNSVASSGRTKGLDTFIEIFRSGLVDQARIITLNHDDLVERKLSEENIPYVDGFGQPDGDVRWYEPIRLNKAGEKIFLIKPHGSITWHQYRRTIGGKSEDNLAIPLTRDIEHCKDADGRRMHHLGGGRPQFLSGGSKELIYNSGIYADMYEAFITALRQLKCMVMSGYGWNDLGLSFRLTTWLDRSPLRKIILLHMNPDEIRFESRGIRADHFEALVKRGQLIVIEKWLCDATLDNLRPHLYDT